MTARRNVVKKEIRVLMMIAALSSLVILMVGVVPCLLKLSFLVGFIPPDCSPPTTTLKHIYTMRTLKKRQRRSLNQTASILPRMLLLLIIASSSEAFLTSRSPKIPITVTRRSSSLRSTTSAGQGGGVFYDGPSDIKQQGVSDTTSLRSDTSSSLRLPAFRQPVPQRKDVVVIGGGLAGLSAALYLSQIDPDRHVCILERERVISRGKKSGTTTVSSLAAAGMLAPQSERLPSGPLLDLCLQSRRLYPDFCNLVETLAQEESVKDYLWKSEKEDGDTLPPHSVGYMASGGFLAPAFAGDAVATWSPPTTEGTASATWLDATQVLELEPNLHPDVVGGWWFPEDASVDARRLTCSLRAACVAAGVEFQQGVEVTSLDLSDGRCRGVWCRTDESTSNKYLETKSVLVANGAWMRQLLPVPLEPHKGQSLSLRMPPNQPPILKRVLFAQDSYIVPKADGRIVVGATVEAGSYDPNVTPAGVLHILSHALQLVPGLADLPMEETWVGLRPTTPDKGPILGKTPWDNLFLAGGYWRNGVLLAPKTGQLLAALLAGNGELLPPADQALLDAFSWDRFTSSEGGAKLAADARYAASMHPIHQRSSGAGVAASVGTELGSYSTARAASEERQKDRRALFESGDDDSLERAAMLGQQDAGVFSYESAGLDDETGSGIDPTALSADLPEPETKALPSSTAKKAVASLQPATTSPYEGSADALTVSHSPADDDGEEESMTAIYERIRETKAQNAQFEMGESKVEERPDPGFRIYHVDETGEFRVVPPYTSPEEMAQIVAKARQSGAKSHSETAPAKLAVDQEDREIASDEGSATFDGYQVIQEANSGVSSGDTARTMRELRQLARSESESLSIDEDALSAQEKASPKFKSEDPAMNDMYQRIRDNKAEATVNMTVGEEAELPDPGFRIYHVDSETGESREVPPFTTPEEMMQLVAMHKAKARSETAAPNGAGTVNGSESVGGGPSCTDGQQEEGYSEQTYDGYTVIQQANARGSREEELDAMRAARQKNRLIDEVDPSQIGAQKQS